MNKIEWKNIEGFDGKLRINSNLEVFRVDEDGKFIKKNIGKDGCYTFHISKYPKRRVKSYVLYLEYFPEVYINKKCLELKDENGYNWLPLVGYEKIYLISENGNLCRLDRNSYANGSPKSDNDYMRISLSYKQDITYEYIHRLVAKTFISNPENKPHVNHIDGNRQNNHISNLEWCTIKENDTHKREVLGFIKEGIHVEVYDTVNDTTKQYTSYVSAGEDIGCCDLTINNYADKDKLYRNRYKIRRVKKE